MAKGATSRAAAEAKRATKKTPPTREARAEAPAPRAESPRGTSRVEAAAKRKTAVEKAPAIAAGTSRIAADAKPAAAAASKSRASKSNSPAPKTPAPKTPAPKTLAPKTPAPKTPAPKTLAAKTPAPKTRPAEPRPAATAARTRKSSGAASPNPTPRRKAKPKTRLPFLAAELGHPVDHEGEPIGAGSRAAMSDTELQHYTLRLWRQMQSRRGLNLHIPAMERAGVTIDQIWTAGVTDRLTTSSTPDDVRRYKQKLLFRANLLEAILTETVSELHRLNAVEPAPPRSVIEPG